MNEPLQEYCDWRGAAVRVDAASGVVRGVKILGLASKNGRRYRPEALARAVSLYEGAKVNVNHPKGSPLAPRDYQDRLGTIRNVALRAGEGLFGDLFYNPKHALAEQLAWDAEHSPENVGFSHNVLAETSRENDGLVVESIRKVQSVDLVADPATTRGLFEESGQPEEADSGQRIADSQREESSAEGRQGLANRYPLIANSSSQSSIRNQKSEISSLKPQDSSLTPSPASDSLTLETLRLHRPDIVEEILSEQAAEVSRLRDELQSRRGEERRERNRRAASALLREYGLPDLDCRTSAARAVVDDALVESLLAAESETEMRRLVEARTELVRRVRQWTGESDSPRSLANDSRPRSRDQRLAADHAPPAATAEEFVRAIT